MKKRCLSLVLAAGIAGTGFLYPSDFNTGSVSTVYSASAYQISDHGIALIKEFEGFIRYAHWDYKQWSIGYGTGVGKDDYPDGITEAEADRLLREVVVVYEKFVQNFLNSYGIQVTQNQYDALVSLTYNMGNIWSNESEVTIRTYLINGISNYSSQQIKDAFRLWCKAGGQVNDGLLRRREKEAELFLSGVEYTAPETGEKWRIKSSTGVRLRTGTDTDSRIVAVIPYNQTFTVSMKRECDGFLWGKTKFSGIEGWCVLDYADYISGNAETEVIEDEDRFEKWTITSDTGVNLRYNYGTGNRVLDVIPYETEITVYETIKEGEFLWGRTEYNGNVGWCVLNYAKKFGVQETPVMIRVKKLPEKTVYLAGELFENVGMTVAAVYEDGREEYVEDYGCEGNTMIPGINIVTVEYKGLRCDLSVTVNARMGDINQNGSIDFEDSSYVADYILGRSEYSPQETGDINGDGIINVFDSMHIMREIHSQNNGIQETMYR